MIDMGPIGYYWLNIACYWNPKA